MNKGKRLPGQMGNKTVTVQNVKIVKLDLEKNLCMVLGSVPGAPDGGWVKLDGAWLRYAERDGDVLRGLRRGQRGTKAIEHAAGTRVHVGRTVEFVVPILHAKDDWNG